MIIEPQVIRRHGKPLIVSYSKLASSTRTEGTDKKEPEKEADASPLVALRKTGKGLKSFLNLSRPGHLNYIKNRSPLALILYSPDAS